MFRSFCATVLFIIGVALPAQAAGLADHYIPVDPPQALPAFAFENAAGQTMNMKDFQGRYVVLNLWATWCAPCAQELPSLDALQEKLASRHVAIIALTEDLNGLDTAQAFFGRRNIRHLKVYADRTGSIPALLHARGLPTSYLIDPQGRELGYMEGESDWALPEAVAFLTKKMTP